MARFSRLLLPFGLTAALLAALYLGTTRSSASAQVVVRGAPLQKWEYKIIVFLDNFTTAKDQAAANEKNLNKLAAEGWELDQMCPRSSMYLILKRPKR